MKFFNWLTNEFTMTQLVFIIGSFVLIFIAGYFMGGLFNSHNTIHYEYLTDTIIETHIDQDVDTLYIPADIDSTTTPIFATFSRDMSRGGYIKGKYIYPPVNRFDIEIKEPEPIIKIKPVIQEKIISRRDVKEYACLGGSAFVAGIIATVILMLKI